MKMNLQNYEASCLINWANGKGARPSRIQIEPTFKCNLKCLYCGRNLKKFDYAKELSDRRWKSIAKSVVGIGFKNVILSGEGEVFSEPRRTLMLMKIFKKNKINGSVITNGTLLNRWMIRDIVRMKWDDMVFSVDGSNAEIHDSLSGVKGSFEKLLRNMLLIKKCKDVYKSKYPEICFITVVTNRNYKDFPNIIRLAKRVGCWKITFMPLFNSPNISSHKFLSLDEKQFSELGKIMDEVKKLSVIYNIQTNADHLLERKEEIVKMDSKEDNVKKRAKMIKQKPWEPCFQPWLTMTLAADGTCRACCFLHNIVDNVKNKSLEEVWYGPIFNKLRKDVYNNGSVPGCEACAEPVILRNKEIERELKKRKMYPLEFKGY